MPLSPRTLRPASSGFNPRQISGLALWLDGADSSSLYTTDAGPVSAVSAPTEISGCVLWLDGADNATITASGGLVSQWNDKSASGAVLQASGSARPTLSGTGFNGRQALVFNGTSTNMASASAYTATNGLSGMTRIAVCQNANTSATVARVWNGGSDMFMVMNGSWRSPVDPTGGTNFASSTTFSAAGTSSLPAGVYADVFASSAITQYGFGSSATATVNGTIPSVTGSGTPTLHVGSNIGANFFWSGPVAEVIYFNRALTRAELARVESYLAAKWGISGVHAPATATSDPVGYWGDKSGNGRHLTQGIAASRPTLNLTGLSSRPCLNFDGTDDNIWRQPGLTSDDLSILLVHQTSFFSGGVTYEFSHQGDTANTQAGNLTGFSNIAGFQVSASAAPNIMCDVTRSFAQVDLQGRSGAIGDITANVPYIGSLCVSYSATLSAIRKQAWNSGRGMSATTRFNCGGWSAVTLGARRNSLVAGGINSPSVFLNGRIAEVIAYSRYLPDRERRRLELYLARKWNVTLAGAPVVSNADAQDWIDRVYGNGGTVSASPAAAVNDFCTAIDGAGIRDRFFRLNLFAGTGLNACLVPLYTGPTPLGFKYGNAVDTNVGPFVSGDYNETGASGGLQGNGTTKRLDTGLPGNTFATSSRHLSAYEIASAVTDYEPSLKQFSSAFSTHWALGVWTEQNNYVYAGYAGVGGQPQTTKQTGHFFGQNTSSTQAQIFRNGSPITSNNTGTASGGVDSTTVQIFGHSTGEFSAGRMGGYSIGLSMTNQQVAAYHTAMQAFQTALSRNV
jgi:hypothetical protein